MLADARFDVRWHASLPSTMDTASALAHDGARHGVVIVADEQTAGRGRRGATWQSPSGAGLYLSFIARPGNTSAISLVTLAAGVAVRDGIQRSTGLTADLKWPNDVIVGKRKLAGILAEGVRIGSPQPSVIVGVGVNLRPAAYPPEVAARATSIESELGRSIDREKLFADIVASLWDRLATLDQKPGDILQAWRAASPNANGTRVEWDGRQGTTAGIDDDGALLVMTITGIERIIAGELRWML
ncbi:MAG TPA: biotin--[acetyl-CoA-carboxylase] ligase [Vicinamibacterales bacterium]|nr:biotin--[acetyl-CoA-carboxylase] ligase [Vicinamibacterales bacterium]